MNIPVNAKTVVGAFLLVIACIFAYNAIENPPEPVNSSEPNYRAVFGSSVEAHRDALITAGFFEGFAGAVEYDGELGSKTKFTTGAALELFRGEAVNYALKGFSFDKYKNDKDITKDFVEVTSKYLGDTLGQDPGAVDGERRKKWVAAFKALGTAARKASE